MNKLFSLKIEKVALGGYGIGFAEGKAVFVPATAIGDEVVVELLRERKDMAFARAVTYSQRGEGAISPECEAFGGETPCGGCDWLNLDYPTQLKYKTLLVKELLQPLSPGTVIADIIPSPEQERYRNKSFMPVGEDETGLYCGIYARWSHRIVHHQHCTLHQQVFDLIARRSLEIMGKAGVTAYNETNHTGTLRHLGFRISADRERILIVIVTRSGKLPFSGLLVKQLTEEFPQICSIVQNINREVGNVILGAEEKVLFGEPWLTDELGGHSFRIHYRSFWQVNTGTVAGIIDHLRVHLSPEDVLYDAYAGIGSLGLSLASSVSQVLCIEESSEAAADGEMNMNHNSISNAGFLCAKTEDALPTLLDPKVLNSSDKPTALILDPPRSGVQIEALQAILHTRIPRVFYLSCSPMTLCRDLKILLADGLYELKSVQPFDMFPQTWHIETLAVLQLKQDTPQEP